MKTVEKDGYEAVQLGFQDKKEKNTTKPLMGHFKKAGVTPKQHLAEFKEFETELNLGDTVTAVSYTHLGYINTIISKKSLRDIISHVIKVCGVAKAADFLDGIKNPGYYMAFKG